MSSGEICVTALMDVNAGDEQHRADNWTVCPSCRKDNRIDYDKCVFCGCVL